MVVGAKGVLHNQTETPAKNLGVRYLEGGHKHIQDIERLYSKAIAFSNRRSSIPLDSMPPTSILCTVSSSKRTAFT